MVERSEHLVGLRGVYSDRKTNTISREVRGIIMLTIFLATLVRLCRKWRRRDEL